MALRTATVYADSDAVVAHVWTKGPGFGSISMASGGWTLQIAKGSDTKAISCSGVNSFSGRVCGGRLDKAAWFSESGAGSATVKAAWSGGGLESGTATMALAQTPSTSGLPLSGAGLWLEAPTYPLLPGMEFEVPLYAHTGSGGDAFPLEIWLADVTIAAPDVEYVSVEPSHLYAIIANFEAPKLIMVAERLPAYEENPAALTSTELRLATVKFRVASGVATGTTIADAVSVWVNQVVSGPAARLEDTAGWVYGVGGVSAGARPLVVAAPERVALHAFVESGSDAQELVNLATLGGNNAGLASAADVPIKVRTVRSCHTRRYAGATACFEGNSLQSLPAGSVACASSNGAVATASTRSGGNCQLDALTTAHTASGDVAVTATHGSFSAAVPFRVWTASSVSVHASDETLQRICASDGGGSALYQSADLHVLATLSQSALGATLPGVDVTRHAALSVEGGGGAYVSLSGSVATGIDAPGSATIAAGTSGASVTLTVTSDAS
ncbi:MAG: hypothetical protein VX747_03805, partial [Actinomycetota bacterium]|nr:hypothetical protein [Actinomycetota bacterium]